MTAPVVDAGRWPLVLVGLPGAGKTTVGRLLAASLGVPFVDLDEEIERRAGATVRAIFAERGEAAFRALEREATVGLAGRRIVLSPGGGWMDDPRNRALVRPPGLIVHLRVSPTAALARIGSDRAVRPLLAGADPEGAIEALARRRAAAYAGADVVVDTEDVAPQAVAERIMALR